VALVNVVIITAQVVQNIREDNMHEPDGKSILDACGHMSITPNKGTCELNPFTHSLTRRYFTLSDIAAVIRHIVREELERAKAIKGEGEEG
jgi:hypothetical protein